MLPPSNMAVEGFGSSYQIDSKAGVGEIEEGSMTHACDGRDPIEPYLTTDPDYHTWYLKWGMWSLVPNWHD